MKGLLFLFDVIVVSTATSVRLRGVNSSPYRGRVEVYHNGSWGTICDDSWTDDDAAVICRMLNFRKGGKAYRNAYFGAGSGHIWLDDVNCTQGHTVNDISDCQHPSWGTNNCGHYEDAGVTCTFINIRLVNGSNDDNGRVEVYHNDSWGTICDDGWTSADSKVVCRQLGYRDQLFYNVTAAYGQGTGPILMDDVNCSLGYIPDRIWNCSFNGWGVNNCRHGEDIGVACAKNSVRLVNGHSTYTGRVEILQNGRWGTICDDAFGDEEAQAVCRIFGKKYGTANAYFGAGTGAIYVDELDCSPSYSSDIDALLLGSTLCSFNGWGINDCSHSEDVGVWCLSQEIRLVTEHLSRQGRVEINYAETWGTICADDWDIVASTLVCRILGYRGGIPFRPVPGSGRIWLDNVRCLTSNTDIAECRRNNWGNHNCDHYKDAGVWCARKSYDVVLADGSDHSGRVNIYYGDSFRTLCYGYLDTRNADVLCRLVGYRYGGKIFKNPNYVETTRSSLRNLRCEGTEASLSLCNGTWGSYNCPEGNDIWIDCITSCDERQFGHLCNEQCHCKVPGCDIDSGRCRRGGCLLGWHGLSCSQECENGTFGQACIQSCHCKTPGCDHVTGNCNDQDEGCEDGWTGSSCDKECGLGSFGTNCIENCHCLVPGCDHSTGVCNTCDCQSGWTGHSCNISTLVEQQGNISDESSIGTISIAVVFSALLVASVTFNIWLYVTNKRIKASNMDKDQCYQNVPRQQLESTVMSQPEYEDLQVMGATITAYENVSFESGYDTMEIQTSRGRDKAAHK
ncbi:deleted in malignant brain tumors 1 protein-like [Mizuhopecten yessoensis]|nr:deleted in malignant brain tumors 1 protein-like [Mizuhopecten yessoensis]XP_021369812.1 deleted in malignant brain tumors 1 protein-like [Mizuhopecten yessoensis]